MDSLAQAYAQENTRGRVALAWSRSRLWQVLVAVGIVTMVRSSYVVDRLAYAVRWLGEILQTMGGGAEVEYDRMKNWRAMSSSQSLEITQRARTSFRDEMNGMTRSSRIVDVPHRLQDYIEGSYLYHWLTAEPEPDVIIIDLRETWTAGPVLAGIDRTVAEITPGVHTSTFSQSVRLFGRAVAVRPIRSASIVLIAIAVVSLVYTVVFGTPSGTTVFVHIALATLGLIGSRSTMSAEELRETQVVQVLIDAFEPPEPPERYDRF